MTNIVLRTHAVRIRAKLLDTPHARMIANILPVQSLANTWGDEIYFEIPIELPHSHGTMEVEIGDVAFWPEETCLCFFFGPTPLSTSEKPLPASEVILVGKVFEGLKDLKKIKDGEAVLVESG